MLLLHTIEKNIDIEYAGFLDADRLNFNCIASLASSETIPIKLAKNGLILLNKIGLLLEIELLFINPFYIHYPTFSHHNIIEGVPFFNIENHQKSDLANPILYINETDKRALILFNNPSNIDLVINHNKIKFFIFKKQFYGIELMDIVFDNNDEKQKMWLQKHNLINKEKHEPA